MLRSYNTRIVVRKVTRNIRSLINFFINTSHSYELTSQFYLVLWGMLHRRGRGWILYYSRLFVKKTCYWNNFIWELSASFARIKKMCLGKESYPRRANTHAPPFAVVVAKGSSISRSSSNKKRRAVAIKFSTWNVLLFYVYAHPCLYTYIMRIVVYARYINTAF